MFTAYELAEAKEIMEMLKQRAEVALREMDAGELSDAALLAMADELGNCAVGLQAALGQGF